ncbi:MAG: AVAST type 3 anti-phage protein Avs3b [Nitrospirota bacterium]
MTQTRKTKPTKKSSSSGPTAPSPMPKDVLDLGRALVEELGLDQGVDTLSCWMAHHLADLIKDAETAKVEDRPAKLDNCTKTILGIWERRHQLPNGKRPFEDFEPILRALESLDPADDTPRYFRLQRMEADETEQNPETKKWLELANGLDYSAKVLIGFCLTQAAQTAIDQSQGWIALAKAAGLEDGIDFPVIRFVTDQNDLNTVSEPDDRARKLIEDRIKRLDGFKEMADALATSLRQQLE